MTATRLVQMPKAELHQLPVHRYAGLFPPLEGDDRARLRDSIRKRGYDRRHPIVITAKTREIVDGRNRRDISWELGIRNVPVLVCEFESDDQLREFIVAENIARRHLSTNKRRELAGKLVLNGASTREAGKAAGVSHMTAQRAAVDARAGVTDVPLRPARRAASGKPNRDVLLGAVGDKLHRTETALATLRNRGGGPLAARMRENAAAYATRARALADALDALAGGQPVENVGEAEETLTA
jgi:ParB-like chromosome segregation protein Spo0J